ncbi:MAG TPA: hypothetical protein V6D20_05995, partial [Candidatus Obscuribacterales bacterium]
MLDTAHLLANLKPFSLMEVRRHLLPIHFRFLSNNRLHRQRLLMDILNSQISSNWYLRVALPHP